MLATVAPKGTADNTKYRSVLKPKFWRSNKTTPWVPDVDTNDEEHSTVTKPAALDDATTVATPRTPSLMKMPTMKILSPSMPSFIKKTDSSMVLKETGRNEIYELSTIDDDGVYRVPVTTTRQNNGKHDHWVLADEKVFHFSLPSRDCLTSGDDHPHSFYTPSSMMIST